VLNSVFAPVSGGARGVIVESAELATQLRLPKESGSTIAAVLGAAGTQVKENHVLGDRDGNTSSARSSQARTGKHGTAQYRIDAQAHEFKIECVRCKERSQVKPTRRMYVCRGARVCCCCPLCGGRFTMRVSFFPSAGISAQHARRTLLSAMTAR